MPASRSFIFLGLILGILCVVPKPVPASALENEQRIIRQETSNQILRLQKRLTRTMNEIPNKDLPTIMKMNVMDRLREAEALLQEAQGYLTQGNE
jgi:hypothetical protein